jgi:hypothetical protein
VDFLEKAVHAGHPRSIAIHLPDAVKDVLDHNFSGDEYKLAKRGGFSVEMEQPSQRACW